MISTTLAHGPQIGLSSAHDLAPIIVGGTAIAALAGVLAVFVVLKRLAFLGQGVSHAAFGGVGLAAILGLALDSAAGALGYYGLIGGFCVATAIGIALCTGREKPREDTVIGVFLVASMAIGFLLMTVHERRHDAPGPAAIAAHDHSSHDGHAHGAHTHADGSAHIDIESVLFGSLTDVGWPQAIGVIVVLLLTLGVLWHVRRPLLFWAFDESGAEAHGLPTGLLRMLLLVLLAIAIVACMKLAGVLLATALLVLPGASALFLSRKLVQVFALSVIISASGMIFGLQLALSLELPPGPSVVLTLVALFALCWSVSRLARSSHPAIPAQ